MKPWKDRQLCGAIKPVLVWDNFSAHHTEAVKAAYDNIGVTIECLLPNTTSILQVMDLVVNGPMKAAVRRQRIGYV